MGRWENGAACRRAIGIRWENGAACRRAIGTTSPRLAFARVPRERQTIPYRLAAVVVRRVLRIVRELVRIVRRLRVVVGRHLVSVLVGRRLRSGAPEERLMAVPLVILRRVFGSWRLTVAVGAPAPIVAAALAFPVEPDGETMIDPGRRLLLR